MPSILLVLVLWNVDCCLLHKFWVLYPWDCWSMKCPLRGDGVLLVSMILTGSLVSQVAVFEIKVLCWLSFEKSLLIWYLVCSLGVRMCSLGLGGLHLRYTEDITMLHGWCMPVVYRWKAGIFIVSLARTVSLFWPIRIVCFWENHLVKVGPRNLWPQDADISILSTISWIYCCSFVAKCNRIQPATVTRKFLI